jgi:hypothetical protein
MAADDGSGSFGISHLSAHPITISVGMALLAVLLILIVLRFAFADVKLSGGVK